MLIHLDSSAISGALEGPETSRSFDCLQELLRAHHKGHHFLSIDPDDIERLARAPAVWHRLSGDHKNVLDRIRATAFEIESVRNEMRHHLVLGIGEDFDGMSHDRGDGHTFVRASLLHFDGVAAERAVLLCENMTDTRFFRAVAELLRTSRRSELALCHDQRGGSGSQIEVEAAHVADEGKILLAIVDSDRRCATGARGPTAGKLERAMRGRPAFQHAHVLPTREAENLIPLTAYERVLEDFGDRAPQLSVLSILQRALRTSEEVDHTDLKDGITLYQLNHGMTNKPEHATWSRVADRRGLARCQQERNECTRADDCRCYVVEKLGARILEDAVRWLRERGIREPRQTCRLLGLSGASPLLEIAEKVIAWGCAYPRLET